MKRPIAILGAGNMASALALNLARHGRPVNLYCIEADVEDDIRRSRCNTKYLPGHPLPANVSATPDIVSVVEHADLVFVAVPSFAVAEVLKKASPHLAADAVVASVSKGFDPETLEPLVATEARLLPSRQRARLCMLGGPAVAGELAAGSPTAFLAAGRDLTSLRKVKAALETATVKVALSRDLKGAALAAALKNVYAIALGLCDGLKYPTNAKALVLTLAVGEMEQLLERSGAQADTAAGLAGLGDLLVTGLSPLGRNRTYGERLVVAASKRPVDLGLGTVEGIAAAEAAVKLTRRLRLRLPLLTAIDRVLRARQDFARPFVSYLQHLAL